MTWSPKGGWICFVSNKDGVVKLLIIKADGSGFKELKVNVGQLSECYWLEDGYIYLLSGYGCDGEMGSYLKDNENAFLVKANDL